MLQKDEVGFESMIRPCVCTKRSSSSFEKQREKSKSCKSCGGKLAVDGRGSQQGSMLSTVGLELSKVIDPQLTWKTASNGRQRAVRRARTSFTGAIRDNSPATSSKSSKDLTGKGSRSASEMPVSESEKLGVSILGRRFSDNIGSVPIKKRRFLLVHSSSPPHRSSNDSGHVSERQLDYTMVIGKSLNTKSRSGSDFGDEGNFSIDKSDQEGVNEKICDAADFSGISILAAAACDCNIESSTVVSSPSKLHSSEIQEIQESAKVDSSPHENVELLPHTSEDLADRTDLPFEASSSSPLISKESNEQSDGSCNMKESVKSAPSKTTESSPLDVRFHWDLNTVMDTWEGHEEGLNSEHGATISVSVDGHHDEKLINVEACMDQVGFGYTKDVPLRSDIVDSKVNRDCGEEKVTSAAERKFEEVSGSAYRKEASSCFGAAQSCSVTEDCPSPLPDAKISVRTLCDSLLSSTFGPEEEKTEAYCGKIHMKVESGHSCVVSCDDPVFSPPANDFGLQLQADKGLIDVRAEVQMEDAHVRSSETEKCEPYPESSYTAPMTVDHDQNSVDIHPAETGFEVLVDGNISKNMVTGSIENAHTNMSDGTDHVDAGKSKEKDICECKTSMIEMELDDTKCCTLIDNTDPAKNNHSTNFSLESDSIGIATPLKSDAPPPALGSEGAPADACLNSSDQVMLEDHLEYDYYSDVSKEDADQTAGMEKFEFLGDDDSQYEDGEFRESLGNCWVDDAAGEGDAERVDYGSDRDTDTCEAASDFISVNRYGNSAGPPESGRVDLCPGTGKHRFDGFARSSGSCPADASDVESGKKGVETITGLQGNSRAIAGSKHLMKDLKGTLEFCADNDIRYSGFLKESAGTKGSIYSANSRMKMSGWDKLPVGGRNSGNGMVDPLIGSVGCSQSDSLADLSRDGGSVKRDARSSSRKDFSSHNGRMQPSDLSRRHDKPHVRASRSNDRNDLIPRAERDANSHREIGRSAPPLHLQGRGRGDRWVDFTSHHGSSSQHEPSGYYGSHHASRNAAAAAVAKVESNGFVVAPDGTIIKAGSGGSSGHLTRRPANACSHSSHRSPTRRGSPTRRERSFGMIQGPMFAGRGKAGRYGGPATVGINHRERYPGPVPDDIIDSPSSIHHPMSRKDRSFSPSRRPLHLSCSRSRSPSRSRTRSPHRWISPRGRNDSGSYGRPGFQRRSRSPDFKPEARTHRPRTGFGERIVNYAPFSRIHDSPPRSSRWTDERKELPEHLSEYEYRRRPGRSSPQRAFSRGQRFDLMDSAERPKPDEYYRLPNPRRFPEFMGFDRGDRHDWKGDEKRDHDSRFGVVHSGRQYANNGNMKCLRYDDENGCRAQNLGSKSSQFQRRPSPRGFNRGTERQLGDSPWQTEEAKGCFRSDGDGNHNDKFKSFGRREGDDNTDAQRRPL